MSGAYQQYSGNPYSQEGGTASANPYGGSYGNANPYGGGQDDHQLHASVPLTHGDSAYSQPSQYSAGPPPSTHRATPLTRDEYIAAIEGAKSRISLLVSNIAEIANIHQRMLTSPDNQLSAQLESIVADTQKRNYGIKDEIKSLERDAAREPNNSFKRTQVETLKRSFANQLQEFQQEEANYSKRYREAIARQYRIVNPDATEQEVNEAANANWGDEGVFQQALRSDRSGQASSVLGAVRARHNDIQHIEQTLSELARLFTELNEAVVYQEAPVVQIEQQVENVEGDTKNANLQLDGAVKSARHRRRLQWWCLLIVVLIILILALVLGVYFGLKNAGKI